MTGSAGEGEGGGAASICVIARAGVHARPAIRLSRLARQFKARIMLRVDGGEWVEARSVLRLMSLRVVSGAELEFSASGEDAAAALREVAALVERHFDEPDGANG